MAHIVTHIAFPSMKSLPSLYPVVLNIEGRRHLVYLLRTRISSYIDCLMTFGLWPFQMFSFSVWTTYISSYFAPFLGQNPTFTMDCKLHGT